MASGIPIPKEKDQKRKKLPTIKSLNKKADGMLTPIIKIIFPRCESCGGRTEVAHHWIEKSRSARLRYHIPNLIPLCHSCHCKIHNKFGNSITGSLDIATLIIQKRGEEWRKRMDQLGRIEIDVNRARYNKAIEELGGLLTNLQKGEINEAQKSLIRGFDGVVAQGVAGNR